MNRAARRQNGRDQHQPRTIGYQRGEQAILQRNKELQDIIAILGMDE